MASELEKVVAEMRAEIANGDGERVQAYMVGRWADRLAALDGGWRPIGEVTELRGRHLFLLEVGDKRRLFLGDQNCWPSIYTPTHYLRIPPLPTPPAGA